MAEWAGEVALSLFHGKGGMNFIMLRTGESGTLPELVPLLKRCGVRQVSISAWEPVPKPEALMRELRGAQIDVASFFVPAPDANPWRRCDLSGRIHPEPADRKPPEYFFLPIRDVPDNRDKQPGGFRDGVDFVTIHNTAEPFPALEERARVDTRRGSRVSFHYAVDEERIVQLLPLDRHGWHAGDGEGDGNLRSVGIEICRSQHRGENSWLYLRSEENAVLLTAALLSVLALPESSLRMHRDWSGKFCPHRILESDSWQEFRRRVAVAAADPVVRRLVKRICVYREVT